MGGLIWAFLVEKSVHDGECGKRGGFLSPAVNKCLSLCCLSC